MLHRMHKLVLAGLLISVSGLVGCAHETPDRFYKNGVSAEDFNRDQYECERDTRMAAASFGRGAVGEANAQDFMIRCMMARGYSYGKFI